MEAFGGVPAASGLVEGQFGCGRAVGWSCGMATSNGPTDRKFQKNRMTGEMRGSLRVLQWDRDATPWGHRQAALAAASEPHARYYQDRMKRAEEWLHQISSELEQDFLGANESLPADTVSILR